MLKKYVFILCLAALAGCAANSAITGQWVQPIPGMEQQMQGFKLKKGGEASSINMATLLYEKWEKEQEEKKQEMERRQQQYLDQQRRRDAADYMNRMMR